MYNATLHVGLAAYTANERFFWRNALVRSGTVAYFWDTFDPMPSGRLDLWIAIVDKWISPLSCRPWLRRLTAPTLIICPQGGIALQASAVIPYPVLICSPRAARISLSELLEMLLEINEGKVLLLDNAVPFSLYQAPPPHKPPPRYPA